MKTCPICKARCFDDMEVCYGCMHRFAGDGAAFGMPVEDATPMADMPLRPIAAHDAPAAAPEPAPVLEASATGHRAPRREAPRVFGAREEDALEEAPPFAESEVQRIPIAAYGDARGTSRLELMPGPVAVASLGGGWRLVVSIERA